MNKLFASVGLVALGASGIYTANGADAGAAEPKLWSVSATLRGFYDDNTTAAPDDGAKIDSFGWEVSPSVRYRWGNDRTKISLGYTYSFNYYEKRRSIPNDIGTNAFDFPDKYNQNHRFQADLDHAFNERYNIRLNETFVVAQEPDILRTGVSSGGPVQPVPGDNIVNNAAITFNMQMTPLFGLEAGYNNVWFDYEFDGADTDLGGDIVPSLSGTSDRLEHYFHIDGRWQAYPQTVLIVGYQFGLVNYTGDEAIASTLGVPVLFSDDRNSRSHYLYVGADHNFRPNLAGSIRVGGRFIDYYNDPNDENAMSPYVRASLNYQYAPESYLEGGFSYDRNSTDRIAFDGADFVRDQSSANVFGTLHHRIVPNLHATLTAQIQNSTFEGGGLDNQDETFYLFGVNLAYKINRHLSADAGFNYDTVDSDAGRSYDRKRVYLGITAGY